jgi:hypothetical protein
VGAPRRRQDSHSSLTGSTPVHFIDKNDKTGFMKNYRDQYKTIEDTATHLLKIIDSATRETDAFLHWDGETLPW